ncbi:hypothetical protein HanRHA438_Chr13g0610251 [Helianthus annuus]|nr:hypothetical protein HanRHA438_Chr13g0610251 [Helianthus annuus]
MVVYELRPCDGPALDSGFTPTTGFAFAHFDPIKKPTNNTNTKATPPTTPPITIYNVLLFFPLLP